ncbi:MAG: hypothetical protein IKL81_03780 [Clostridia bacterium]|nr:hypothetical protein [Clostridia bacterium]
MRILRIFSLIIAISSLIFALSCSDESLNGDIEQKGSLDLVKNGETAFTIIRPELYGNDANVDQMKAIRDSFKEKTGIRMDMDVDWVKIGQEPDPEKYEILIGNTNRPESQKALEGLKYNDYVVKIEGNKIVLNGYSSEAQQEAVDYFINEVLSKAEIGKDFSVSESINITHRSEYKIDKFTLAGNDLGDYSIFVPKDADYLAADFANKLQQLFIDNTGYYLPITSDKKSNVISISYRDSITDWGYTLADGKINCTAHGMFGFEALYDMLDSEFEGKSGDLTYENGWELKVDPSMIKDEEIVRSAIIDGDFRIMFHNVLSIRDVINRDELSASIYLTYLPDVIGFQEVASIIRESDWFDLIAHKYSEVAVNATNVSRNNYVPIFYRHDKFELIDSGWKQYNDGSGDETKGLTWAVFSDIETQIEFAVVNTHFFWTGDEAGNSARIIDAEELLQAVKSIKEKYNVPVIIGGDLNCSISSEPLQNLLKGGLLNAHDNASVYKTTSGGYHAYPGVDPSTGLYAPADEPKGDYSRAIDHVYYFGDDTEIRVFDYIIHPVSLAASDHSPVYVDVKIND